MVEWSPRCVFTTTIIGLGVVHTRLIPDPLFIHRICRCHANFCSCRGQVVQDMARERRRSRDEDVCCFNFFYNFENRADGSNALVIT